MTYPDIMLDLETLGKGENAVVLQIGFALFNRADIHQRPITRTIFPNIQDQLDDFREIDEDTMTWWTCHNHDGWLYQMARERTPTSEVFDWIDSVVKTHTNNETLWWAKSTPFDMSIMKSYYGTELWNFRNVHDMRTLRLAAGDEHYPYDYKNFDQADQAYPGHDKPLVPHDAESDAFVQAVNVMNLWRGLEDMKYGG